MNPRIILAVSFVFILGACDRTSQSDFGYSKQCETQEDCRAVALGDVCGSCPIEFAAINTSELERFNEAVQEKRPACEGIAIVDFCRYTYLYQRARCADNICYIDDVTPATETDCTDGIDNNENGITDCEDYECYGLVCECGLLSPACEEYNCGDQIDNNEDGLEDCEDPRCASDPLCATSP